MEKRKLGRAEEDEDICALGVRLFLESWSREEKNLNPLIKCLCNTGDKGQQREVLKFICMLWCNHYDFF